MSIEQTTQLIQLILNSVLMVAVGAAVWLGLMLRWVWLDSLLRGAGGEVLRDEMKGLGDRPWRLEQSWGRGAYRSLLALRRSNRRLKRHHQMVAVSLLVAHGSLLLLVSSTLLLALRTLVQANWLIQLSLGVFVLGVGGVLLALGLCLTDWAMTEERGTVERGMVRPQRGEMKLSLRRSPRRAIVALEETLRDKGSKSTLPEFLPDLR
ncbi:hypothetical protein [Thermoleptolyngbya sp. C42_A2020_037]|uniref:hypothetical protein n=1 Tax=Thermoleptolyngbya sp. C42_A2020_037 TaxID=2747799 RepID=UPI0019FD0830|nr:hypothetical protein [Thermoleptolyngbya sp. C42_A2020_037]MBF2084323.1 hypothetical protein [Thermoleptolyngbya sp. C42_A2020_037]